MSAIQKVDAMGLRCPHPVLVLGNETARTPPGTVVEITADCPTLEKDVRQFCERRGKTILAVLGRAPTLTIQIQY